MNRILIFTILLGLGGCSTLDKNKSQTQNAQTQKVSDPTDSKVNESTALKQQQEWLHRDLQERIDAQNSEQLKEQEKHYLAKVEQTKKDADVKIAEVQKHSDSLAAEVSRLNEELVAKEHTVKSLNASFKEQAMLPMSPVGSVLTRTPSINVSGVTVLPRDGTDVIRIAVNDSVVFHPNTTELLSTAPTVLGKVLNEIRANYPKNMIGIEGHTDSFAENPQDPMQAIELSLRKANSIATYLLDQERVSGQEIKLIGYGAARPLRPNSTAEGRSQNNRVEFVVYP